ncbi:MAG TPA: AAA family ATPase, partial [Acidimicrobiales bacterium]|nr:AAA family ATPase [Acidimicrobiales bacterium]
MTATDLVTIVYTDWVGSSATRARLGEERADELQRIHDRLLREAVVDHGGSVVKGSGDGVLATFHSATGALAMAVAVQQRFDVYSRDRAALAPVSVRIGISAGDVVHQDADIFGTPVVEAARLEALAEPGQILCSELVRLLARGRGGFEFELLGMFELKGLLEPLATSRVRWEPSNVGAGPAFPLPPELATTGEARFVGRDEQLRAAIDLAMNAEQANALWLLGEPGIGKTRLATEVALQAHAAGAVVLFGRCDEYVAAPFQPLTQALRWYVGHVDDDQLAPALGVDPEALARLVPEIRARLPGLRADNAPTTETEQYRLFEAARSWLAATAASRPVVFVVDDAHWADRPTLAWVGQVVRNLEPARLLVIGTGRDTEPDASDPLRDLVDDLQPTGRSRRLRLGGLNVDEVATLVAAAKLSQDGSEHLAERLVVETAGNPLFVGAVLAGLVTGAQDGEAGGELPTDVRVAVRRRVRGLALPVRELLQVAALVGLEFPLKIPAAVVGIGEAESLSRIERAVGAGIVHEISVDRFRFTHGLVQDALIAELSHSRQAHLHGAIAASMEQQFGSAIDDYLRALAHHWANAGGDEGTLVKALEYAVRSARRGLELLAFDAAVEDYDAAVAISARLTGRPSEEGFELLIAKGEAERLAALYEAAATTLRSAAGVARDQGDWAGVARAGIALEEATWRPGALSHDAVRILRDADAHSSALPADRAVVVRASLGRALHYVGREEEGAKVAEAALIEARQLGDAQVLAHALVASMVEQFPLGRARLDVKLERAEEAWQLRDRLSDVEPLGTAAEFSFALCLDRADRASAARWHDRLGEVLDRIGWSRFSRYVWKSEPQVMAFLDGELGQAERQANEVMEIGRSLGSDVSGVHGVQMFLIRREQDRLAELLPMIRMVMRFNPVSAMWRPGLALLLAEVGIADEARQVLDELAIEGLAAIAHDHLYVPSLCFLAETAVLLGAIAAGGRLADLLAPCRGTGVTMGHPVGNLGAADRYLGLLAWLLDRLDEAEDRFEEGLAFNRRLGAVVWEAHTLADWAGL